MDAEHDTNGITLRQAERDDRELLLEVYAAGREIELIPDLCDGAFEAVLAGDTARHDELLSSALQKLRAQVEVVVLAQASMARVAGQFKSNGGSPILSSPELAMVSAQNLLLTGAVV